MKYIISTLVILFVGLAYAGVQDGDVVTETGNLPANLVRNVQIPANFDVEQARIEMKLARKQGDAARAQELYHQISAWWAQNHTVVPAEPAVGDDSPARPVPYDKESRRESGASPLWGNDVRIDPRDDIYPGRIAALSNGDLYAIGVLYDGSNYWGVIRRSTNNGQTWSDYWNNQFASTTRIIDPGIMVIKDTLVYWYILDHYGSNEMRTWVKVSLPGGSDDPIYFGSPTGSFNPVDYGDLWLHHDGSVYPGEYLYATWIETYGTGPDSTRIMHAASFELDVSSWEQPPVSLEKSSGANIYYANSRIWYGSGADDMMWIVTYLHPYDWPATYDRAIWGLWSNDYGSTWSSILNITPYTNNRDEFDPAIAGSHAHTNWSILETECDENWGSDLDIVNWYSTDDGANWVEQGWVTNSYENSLSDIYVDDASTAFFGMFRQDNLTTGDEMVRYKRGLTSDPSSWTESVYINEDVTQDLSGVYGPSAGYNPNNGDAICAYTNWQGGVYSLWFTSESYTSVEEQDDNAATLGFVSLAPNPSRGLAELSFAISHTGQVRVSIFDATGRLVQNVLNESKKAGTYSITVDGTNLSNGIYFVHIVTPEGQTSEVMTVVR
jgi:hypothetical protein